MAISFVRQQHAGGRDFATSFASIRSITLLLAMRNSYIIGHSSRTTWLAQFTDVCFHCSNNMCKGECLLGSMSYSGCAALGG